MVVVHDKPTHDDVIKWKHFPRYWPFVRAHKGQYNGALMFSLICAWTNDRENNHEAGDLRRHRAHYDVIVTICFALSGSSSDYSSYCIVPLVVIGRHFCL